MDLKWEGEMRLRRSGMAYTVVRPGRLLHGDLGAATAHVGQTNAHFMNGAGSTRADVAAVAVAAASAPACLNTTFEMACDAPSKKVAAIAPTTALFDVLDATWDKQWT